MTSIEWLWEQIDGIIPYQDIKTSQLFNGVLDQAKEMHKQEIIDSAERWKGTDFAERYYQETFVSKGSDECQFEPTTNTSSATICANCGKEKFLHKT